MEGTGKLVRDRIPELIRANGGQPQTRTAHDEEFPALLRLKLLEEVQEYLDSEQPDELVDVIEVVHALAKLKGVSPDALEQLRAAKQEERGGFDDQTVLFTLPDDPAPDNVAAPANAPASANAPAPADAPANAPAPGGAGPHRSGRPSPGPTRNGTAPTGHDGAAPGAPPTSRQEPGAEPVLASEAKTVENPIPPPHPARVIR